MFCPKCFENTTCKNSVKHITKENNSFVFRERKCKSCGYVFCTREIVCETPECERQTRLWLNRR